MFFDVFNFNVLVFSFIPLIIYYNMYNLSCISVILASLILLLNEARYFGAFSMFRIYRIRVSHVPQTFLASNSYLINVIYSFRKLIGFHVLDFYSIKDEDIRVSHVSLLFL